MRLARLLSLPTTLSVAPEEEKPPELIAELREADDFAARRIRSSASPFQDRATTETLEGNGRKILAVAGFATEVVVLHAAIDAARRGYDVIVPVDVCGGMSDRSERAAFRQIEGSGGIPSSVVSIATKLSPDFTTDMGRKMFEIVQEIRLA